MRTNQYHTPIFAFDGEGAVAPWSFENNPSEDDPRGLTLAIATLG